MVFYVLINSAFVGKKTSYLSKYTVEQRLKKQGSNVFKGFTSIIFMDLISS
jgi:hypothetical protein